MRSPFVLCLILAAVPARASDASAQAAASYSLDTAGSTAELPAGGAGRLVLVIRPRPGIQVQRQAPLRARLAATPGLALARTRLARADLVDATADAPRFEVPFTATAAGAQEVKASLDFFLCSATWCVRQAPELTFRVEVR